MGKNANEQGPQTTGYYHYVRHDLIPLIPGDARRVLEIGCGAGQTGRHLKETLNAFVAGIELNPSAAREARMFLDDVIEDDVEAMNVPYEDGSFDCILFADVLEHLNDPLAVIKKFKKAMASDGKIVASIPNVQFYEVVHQLIEGNWTYQDEGILDRTHLRFYTYKEILKLFQEAGLEIELIGENLVPQAEEMLAGGQNSLKMGRLQIFDLSPEEIRRFFVYQYKVVARKASDSRFVSSSGEEGSLSNKPKFADGSRAWMSPIQKSTANLGGSSKEMNGTPLVSVVIPAFNGERFIGQSLESVLNQSYSNLEILVCDDASEDGTEGVVRRYDDRRIRWCPTGRNLGQVKNLNRGLRLARGEFVCWLNQDDQFLENKIEEQLKAFARNPELGAVFSRKLDVDENLKEIDRPNPSSHVFGTRSEALNLFFVNGCTVCASTVMLHGKVFDAVGYFDEQFQIAFDYDMWFRILKRYPVANLGIPLLKYRHHAGNTSGEPKNRMRIIEETQRVIQSAIERIEIEDLDPQFAEEIADDENRMSLQAQFWMFYAEFYLKNGVPYFRETLAESFKKKAAHFSPRACLTMDS